MSARKIPRSLTTPGQACPQGVVFNTSPLNQAMPTGDIVYPSEEGVVITAPPTKGESSGSEWGGPSD